MQTKTISRRKFVLGASMGAALAACAAPIKTLTVDTPEKHVALTNNSNAAAILPQSTAKVPFAPSAAWHTSYQTSTSNDAIVQSYVQDTASWQERWTSLSAAIDELRDTLRPDMPRYGTLSLLLNQLQTFGAQQFNQLSDALARQTPVADGEAATHAIYDALDQIAYDIQIVERAVFERLVGSPSIKASLDKIDVIVAASLQPAIDAGLFANLGSTPTVITYFMKNPSIRVIPYASVALVGIPYSAASIAKNGTTLSTTRDLLAIPHEVGHFVYWHGTLDVNGRAMRIVDALPKLIQAKYGNDFPQWMSAWLEESFADVYGGLVAGPLSALEFQDMAMVHSRNELITDDGDHPLHAMRSDLFIQLLGGKMGMGQWASVLQARWQALRDSRLAANSGKRFNAFVPAADRSPDSLMALSVADLQQQVTPVSLSESAKFGMLLNVLEGMIGRVQAQTRSNWWSAAYGQMQPAAPAQVAAQLYSAFDQHARQTTAGLASTQTLDGLGDALKQQIQLRAWKLEGPQTPQTGTP